MTKVTQGITVHAPPVAAFRGGFSAVRRPLADEFSRLVPSPEMLEGRRRAATAALPEEPCSLGELLTDVDLDPDVVQAIGDYVKRHRTEDSITVREAQAADPVHDQSAFYADDAGLPEDDRWSSLAPVEYEHPARPALDYPPDHGLPEQKRSIEVGLGVGSVMRDAMARPGDERVDYREPVGPLWLPEGVEQVGRILIHGDGYVLDLNIKLGDLHLQVEPDGDHLTVKLPTEFPLTANGRLYFSQRKPKGFWRRLFDSLCNHLLE